MFYSLDTTIVMWCFLLTIWLTDDTICAFISFGEHVNLATISIFFYLILGNSQKWAENFYSNFELVRENRGKKYYRISSKQKPKQKKKKRKSSISWWENQRTLKHCIATSLSHSPFEYWNTILRPKKICVKNVFLLVFYSV